MEWAGSPLWWRKHDVEPPKSKKTKDDDYSTTVVADSAVLQPPPTPTPPGTDTIVKTTMTEYGQSTFWKPPFGKPSMNGPPVLGPPATSLSSMTTKIKPTAYPDAQHISAYTVSSSSGPIAESTSSNEHPGGFPDWQKGPPEQNEILYAAVIVPVVILAIIGLAVFCCLRKRKRKQKAAAADGAKAEEMNMPWNPRPLSVARPYLAPLPVALPQYTPRGHDNQAPPTSVPTQPIILGPIPSGTNGAYLTGIDTSDVVSITSANNLQPGPIDPFSDSSSLSDAPPPPYRPQSVAPPSFVSGSRQSSVRVSAPPATSQTHLIDRSPFDDPRDDDTVSELSARATTRSREAMSAVSDLSYQNDPVVNRTSI